MSGNDVGHLVYLVLLGSVILSYFLVSNRRNLGQTARHAVLWGLIFVGVIAGVGLWGDIRDDVLPQQSVFAEAGRIEVPQARDGHFYLTAEVNGTPIRFVVDTGATDIVLSRDDAIRAGLNPDTLIYNGRAGTANGTVEIARAVTDTFAIGGVRDRDVSVSVNGGEMRGSLLGMAYLRRFDRIEIADGLLVLQR